ncbi:MAG: hypothetical protein PVF04_05875, partial [Anaerolineae bacterium]
MKARQSIFLTNFSRQLLRAARALIIFGALVGSGILPGSVGSALAKDGLPVSRDTQLEAASGTITIRKEVTPEGGPSFGFTSDIPDNSTFTLSDGDSITFLEVPLGSYTITEDDPGPLYVLSGLSCSYGASLVSLDLDNRSLTVDLADGDTVDCTYYNDKQAGTITIRKEVTPEGGPSFGFTSDIPDNSAFALNDGDSITFLEVPLGSYTLTEDDPGPLYVLSGL